MLWSTKFFSKVFYFGSILENTKSGTEKLEMNFKRKGGGKYGYYLSGFNNFHNLIGTGCLTAEGS
jgi:hypothetical protein